MMLSIRHYCIYWIPIRLAMVSMTYATAIDFAHHTAHDTAIGVRLKVSIRHSKQWHDSHRPISTKIN